MVSKITEQKLRVSAFLHSNPELEDSLATGGGLHFHCYYNSLPGLFHPGHPEN
jgi:hypothetical protein